MESKRCNVCQDEKPLADFYRHAKSPDGRGYTCKKCSVARARQWAKEHPDRHRENVQRRSQSDEFKAKRRARYAEKRADRAAARSNWYTRNRDEINAKRRERYSADPEYRAKNLANRRQWSHENRGAHARWWREYAYGLTREQYDAMVIAQLGRCAICDQQSDLVVDHIDTDDGPVVRGLLCDRCNHGLGHFRDSPERLIAAVSYLLGGS